MPSPNGWSSSTARSAPTCRISSSARTTSAARRSRGATRCSASPAPTSSAACTGRSSTSASTPSRPPASAASRWSSTSTASPTRRTSSTSPPAVIAREVADELIAADGRERWVAGSIGPGTKLPSLGHIGFAALRDAYEEQAAGLLDGGVDLFLIETCYDLLQAKAAMIACRRAMRAAGRSVPLQVQVSMETTGRMLLGSEIGAALVSVAAMGADVIGVNCSTGPAEMQEHLRYLSQHSPRADLGAPERRPAERRRRPHPLRPDARAARRVPPTPRGRARHQRRRRLLRHDARASAPGGRGGPRRRPGTAHPGARSRACRRSTAR